MAYGCGKNSRYTRQNGLFTEASIAETEGKLTIDEGRKFYGQIALTASQFAEKQNTQLDGGMYYPFKGAIQPVANTAVNIALEASNRMIRGLETKNETV